ncbi:hypothetical protein [Flavobacterium sp. WC2509]|uniref:hypothetical protein n=1 Tax=Flavobacterium sp. WC2509 TaxID=3461406 RepID=UPI004043AC6C
MKNLITAALIAFMSVTGFAQEKQDVQKKHQGHQGSPMEKFTPEQRNQLMLKKMTLELDLTASQQKEMGTIIAEQSAKKEAFLKNKKTTTEKPTSDQIFEMKMKMLDEQIATKAKVKKILSADQYKKWDELKEHHREGMKNHYRQEIKKDTTHRKEQIKK